MKKRLLSLILCIYLLVSPVLELSAFGTEPEAPAAEAEVTAPVETDTLEWMSYNDFLREEALRAWDYPSMFVGSEAVFNVDGYDNFRLAPDPEYIRNLAEAALAQEAAEIAAANAAVMGEGAVEEAGEEAASEEAAPPMLPEETDGASSGGSESEEVSEGEIISEPAVMEDALTEPVIDEQPAAAEDEAAEGEDPEEGTEGEDDGYIYIDREDLLDENGSSIRVVITDCLFIDLPDESELLTCGVWYRVAAAEGYTLPETLANNPYVQNLAFCGDEPSLLIDAPVMGMFVGETAELRSTFNMTDSALNYAAANAPAFFPVTYIYDQFGNKWYDLGDISAWSFEGVELGSITEPQNYHYVAESSVVPVPAVVSLAYEKLLDAENRADFESIQSTIPQGVLDLFPTQFKEAVEAHHQELIAKETVTLNESVTYNGIALPVSVKGKIPADAVLSVTPVSSEQVALEGFSVSATDIVTALDIKIFNADGTEWQPADGEEVELRIGMSQLGVADGSVFKLHHKHNGVISTRDIFVVMEGCLTIYTTGFSIYVVDNTSDTNGTAIQNGGSDTIYIGDEPTVYYFPTGNNRPRGTWTVIDPDGAVYFTVHSNQNPDGDGLFVPWIEIVPLKETTAPIVLSYSYSYYNNVYTESYSINVEAPHAPAGGKKLYIKDDVNKTGRILAALSDQTGNDISDQLDGATFKWTRIVNDPSLENREQLIMPHAYGDNYSSVNIAMDHAGLTEARKNNNGYITITYELDVQLADGSFHEASYTVYYQSEIINASFESPKAPDNTHTFYPNGWPELYWKTTAPGTQQDDISRDIEYGDVSNGSDRNYGVSRAADHDNGGKQFAELNAENFGALYQDIITAPGEEISWDFAHAARTAYSWQGTNTITNAMYLVIGPTESAQALTSQTQLENLGAAAKAAGGQAFLNGTAPVTIEFEGAQYTVWYHDAKASELRNNRSNIDYSAGNNYGWYELEGSYEVPEGQYRTRLFFVSDATGSDLENAGNLIDKAKAGQYKTYLIEYYVQTYEGDNIVNQYQAGHDESGESLIYSAVTLNEYEYFIETQRDFLYLVEVNGEVYPYDLRYMDSATLYIQNYNGVKEHPEGTNSPNNYADYDIVMHVYLRDTMVGVQKELVFPDALTEEQKLNIIANLNSSESNGYVASYELNCVDADNNYVNVTDRDFTYSEDKSTVITARDPAGNYKAYVGMADRIMVNHHYQLTETDTSEIPGLYLKQVDFSVTTYKGGQPQKNVLENTHTYNEETGRFDGPLTSESFFFTNNNTEPSEDDVKIADVRVVNTYEEVMVPVRYEAVGNGKVTLNGTTNFQDAPYEEIKYYSGTAVGGAIHEGKNATFVGWYHDKECTKPVQNRDGKYDENTGSFYPNANVIVPDASGSKTFYAKFVTFSVVIEKTDGEPGKTYVYTLEGDPDAENVANVEMEVYVTCDENGYGRTEIFEAPKGTYTATEQGKWSWRDTAITVQKNHNDDASAENPYQIILPFDGDPDARFKYWLDGFSNPKKNVFTKHPDEGGTA